MAAYQGSLPLASATLLIVTSLSLISAQTGGVYLSLNGVMTIPNDSYVLASNISEGDDGLRCNTNRSGCCRSEDGSAQGYWYFPAPPGGQVLIRGARTTGDYFYRDRYAGQVRLNRVGNPSERGRFRCEIPNADGALVNISVNIVDMMVSISLSGGNAVGENYRLRCTVTVTGSTDQPVITWLMGPMNREVTAGVETTGSMSTLTFNPLAASHVGIYTCRATLGSIVVDESTTEAFLSRPPTISIVSRRGSDGCGEVMTLNCTAHPVERNLFSPPTIVWFAPDGTEVPTVESNNPRMIPQTGQLIFSDITRNNRGQYTCHAVFNISQVQTVHYTDANTVQVNTNFPGKVGNLVCASSSSPSELSFSWDLPTLLGAEVVSYQVLVNRLEHRTGTTRGVTQSGVYNKFVDTQAVSVIGLAAEVPYNVTVKAVNLAGCGEDTQTYCFTKEGVPPPPENVVVVRYNPTSIGVSWTKYTLVELKGLANYIVTYTIIINSRKRQSELAGTVIIPWTQNQAIISGLQPGAEYAVTIRTLTTAGISVPVGPGDRISTANSPQTAADPPSSSSDNTVAVVGGVVVVIAVSIVVAITILVAIALLRGRRAEFRPKQKPLPYEGPGSGMLSDLSPTNKERQVYETIIEANREYEILDKDNRPQYEDVKTPPPKPKPEVEAVQMQPLPSPGDCGEFTQCPAYAVPMATTSIHSNKDEQEAVSEPASPSTSKSE